MGLIWKYVNWFHSDELSNLHIYFMFNLEFREILKVSTSGTFTQFNTLHLLKVNVK